MSENMNINDLERLNLKKLISESNCENNTESIRQLKHSVKIRDDIRRLEKLKVKRIDLRNSNPEEFFELAQSECNFLFNNYMDIFTRVMKDELDLNIMTRLLGVLKMIEEGKVDQHEGSVLVGRILKELYLDSAVKRADNLDRERNSEKIEPMECKNISWAEYKKMNV